jgi:organic hydroperoxide reductase OsmC/OhrA
MSHHLATITWVRTTPDFTYDGYSRDHAVAFGTGATLEMSGAAEFRGNPALPNPEEQLVAALSSCHMLTFLAICARKRITVDRYVDAAHGVLAKNAAGKLAVTAVTLRPRIVFSGGNQPDGEALARLHHLAHEQCFIASSVTTEVTVSSE